MATVHSSRACLPKLCCSITAAGLFIAGLLLTGAYPHQNLDHFDLNQTALITNGTNLTSAEKSTLKESTTNRISRSLRTTVTAAQNKALQAILHAYIFRNTDTQAAILHKFLHQVNTSKSRASRSTQRSPFQQYLRAIAAARLEAIHANKDSLYAQLDTAITKIEDNALAKLDRALTKIEQNAAGHKHRTRRANSPGLRATTKAETTTEWFLRNLASSPFPIQTIRAFEKALHILTHTVPQNKPEYATGVKRWKREPSVYPFQVKDLLEYEVRSKHSQNKIMGEKIAKILHQNTDLSNKIAEDYQTPSEKLKKDPIMALVTRTISTYMLVKHSKNGKEKSQPENLSPWGEPFFKKKE
jgi:hypothetical protein